MIKRLFRWLNGKAWSVEIPFLPKAVQITFGIFWPTPTRMFVDGECVRKQYYLRQFYSVRRITWSPDCIDWLLRAWPFRAVVMVKDYGYGKLRDRQ